MLTLVCKKNFSSFGLPKTIQSRRFCTSVIQKPSERYNRLVVEGKIRHDENQIPVLDKLDGLFHQITTNTSSPKGVYIFGEVGSGKTFLMDLFYKCLPENITKRRDHYDHFMKDLHSRMWKKSRTMKGKSADAFPFVVDEIVADSKVLCFDEFQLPDVGSAILLSNMLRQAISKELVLVATSNLSPEEVCTRGLHHNRIGDFFELLQEKCEVVHLNSTKDYRVQPKKAFARGKRFFYPTAGGNEKVIELWNHLTKRRRIMQNESISPIRNVLIPKSAMQSDGSNLALFDYSDLFVKPYGAADYQLITEVYEYIFITNVPKFTLQNKNEAKRFINFIDQAYNRKCKLIFASDVPFTELFELRAMTDQEFDHNLDLAEDKLTQFAKSKNSNAGVWMEDFKHDGVSLSNVYTSGRAEKFASARTISRLQEMSSDLWWGISEEPNENITI